MGLASWFETFCTGLQVDNSEAISNRYSALTTRLNTDFWNTTSATAHSLYVGSYGRNTAIRGFGDVDMIFDLPWAMYTRYNDYTGNGQSACYKRSSPRLKEPIRKRASAEMAKLSRLASGI